MTRTFFSEWLQRFLDAPESFNIELDHSYYQLDDLTTVEAAPQPLEALPRLPSTLDHSYYQLDDLTTDEAAPQPLEALPRLPSTRSRVKTTGEELQGEKPWLSKEYDCRLCNQPKKPKSYYEPSGLFSHYRTRHGIDLRPGASVPKTEKDAKKLYREFHPKRCFKCPHTIEYPAPRFATSKQLEEHLVYAHVPKSYGKYKCLICDKRGKGFNKFN